MKNATYDPSISKRALATKIAVGAIGVWIFICALILLNSASSANRREYLDSYSTGVYDEGDYFLDYDEAEIAALAKKISDELKVHVIVFTVKEMPSSYPDSDSGSAKYAEDFYRDKVDDNAADPDGFLFLFDLERRYIYIHTSGYIFDRLSTDDCEKITAKSTDEARAGMYADMAKIVISGVQDKINGDILAYYTMRVGVSIVVALIVSLIVWLVVRNKKRSKVTVTTNTYIDEKNCHMIDSTDNFTRQTVSVSYHSSGSGRSGGGGGGGGGGRSGGGGSHF